VTAGASGASEVTLVGAASSGALDASGASTLNLKGLPLRSATLDVSGASVVIASVSETISGTVSGASRATITGTPGGDVNVSGASTVTRGAR
jgi:hypothetical protein